MPKGKKIKSETSKLRRQPYWGLKDHINMSVLQSLQIMVSGILLVLGLRTFACRILVFMCSLGPPNHRPK